MAVRSRMANLILRVQELINDPAVSGQDGVQFTAQRVQDTLDRYVRRFRHYPMDWELSYSNTLPFSYQDYNAPFGYGDWEEDAVFQSASYAVITTDGADWISGRFHFSVSY